MTTKPDKSILGDMLIACTFGISSLILILYMDEVIPDMKITSSNIPIERGIS